MISILDESVAPEANLDEDYLRGGLERLVRTLSKIPSLSILGNSDDAEPYWWIKLNINISAATAWHVVQELGYIFNNISAEEKLPTVFFPASSPPYLS